MNNHNPVGLVWHPRYDEDGECYEFEAGGPGWHIYIRCVGWKWEVWVEDSDLSKGEAPTLDAAKAAAEACLRAWVARLNASLGGA